MGFEILLIAGGLIVQSASHKGESLYSAGHTATTIGLVILAVEVVWLIIWGLVFRHLWKNDF